MPDKFETQLYAITTIITTKAVDGTKKTVRSASASGFYYNEVEPEPHEPGEPHWVKINKYWLITNRHVVYVDENFTQLVDELTFCLRKRTDWGVEWIPIHMNQQEIMANLKVHTMHTVDVVALDVSVFVNKTIVECSGKGMSVMIPTALSKENLPDNQPLPVDVTSDIAVVSYPKGFYDKYNKFPIVKSGIIASAWGLHFNGLPLFLIDCQLFPGSSGGLVLSKPTNIAFIDGTVKHCATKQFALLGIYSGEYYWEENEKRSDGTYEIRKQSYGLGNVWYSYLIEEIISSGLSVKDGA